MESGDQEQRCPLALVRNVPPQTFDPTVQRSKVEEAWPLWGHWAGGRDAGKWREAPGTWQASDLGVEEGGGTVGSGERLHEQER